ncbi:hypothetical protein Dsin_017199 [Dipteronia sinensis]|uniref:Uncharacterized protein n=1 Tax=Dipteronia sinensis TaxID=43782 RepID=A0AAE0AFC1_9ROSI|nr:hypothetical protein Dsin_017199 [Dipteronia sinensis]
MIISPAKGVEYGRGNEGMRPAWGAGAAEAEAGQLMGDHLWSVSQVTGGRRANSVSHQQVSNNIGNPNSTTTTPNHTAAAAPTCPRFTFVSQSHGVNYDHSQQHHSYENRNGGTQYHISQSHHHNVQSMRLSGLGADGSNHSPPEERSPRGTSYARSECSV